MRAEATRTRPSNSSTLRIKLDLATPALNAATDQLWHAPGLAHRYPAYLRLMHGVIRASVPMMEHAARRCAALEPADSLAAPLLGYLAEHIEEERGHDAWLLADLAALGHDPADTLSPPPPPVVARLVGAQYFWIEHFHPVALLGYLVVMEGNSPAPWLPDWIAAAANVPDDALRTVREHAEIDTGHTDDVRALLDALTLTGSQAEAVALSALHTAEALTALFDHLVRGPHGGRAPHTPASSKSRGDRP
jgi:hypothetical protein